MKIIETKLSGLIVIEPTLWIDHRGYFLEVFQEKRYADLGLPNFVQDNISRSKQNVLRGLHYQKPHTQAKLIGVTRGTIWDVVVDLRLHSRTFGEWFHIILSDENHKQLFIPEGLAHGFCVLSEEADIHYKCTNFYEPPHERGIIWNDKQLNIPWPIKNPILSSKDSLYPSLQDISHEYLFN